MSELQTTRSIGLLLRNRPDLQIFLKMSIPQWKRTNPPCKAQTILQEMFKNNMISPDATACATHKLNPEFLEYKLSVFRGAFSELRNKYGLGCNCFCTNHVFHNCKYVHFSHLK
jgi:hypothetical protein